MENAKTGVNLIILDACRDNPFRGFKRSLERGLKVLDAPKDSESLIAYATAPGSVAADGKGRNGIYTGCLLKYLLTPNQPVETLFRQVRKDVKEQTGGEQVPWLSLSMEREFSFLAGGSGLVIRPDVQPTPTVASPLVSSQKTGDTMSLDLGGGVKMEFVWVKALNGWVGKYEVTNGEYRRFKSDYDSGAYENRSLNGDRQPVANVSYDDATTFCEWMNRTCAANMPKGYQVRLPDGNEWMTFAQCGDSRKYPWGNDLPPKCGNYADTTAKRSFPGWTVIDAYDDGYDVSCPVEKSGKNDLGLYGVGGNVWEWTSEQEVGVRVLRGASWDYGTPVNLGCASRGGFDPWLRSYDYGLRVVMLR